MNEIIQKINEMIPRLNRDAETLYKYNPQASELLKALSTDLGDMLRMLTDLSLDDFERIVSVLSTHLSEIDLARASMNPVDKTFMGNYRHQLAAISRGIMDAFAKENGL